MSGIATGNGAKLRAMLEARRAVLAPGAANAL